MPTMTTPKRRRKHTPPEEMTLPELLAAAEAERARRGLNQTEAAALLGLRQSNWAQLMSGRHGPSGPVRRLLELFVAKTI